MYNGRRKNFGEYREYSSEESESDNEAEISFESPGPKQGKRSSSGLINRTNKNGLPFEVQRTILHCVLHYNGKDNFSTDFCDKNPGLLGERNSGRRIACRSKRLHFLKIGKQSPHQFVKLCEDFELEIPENSTLLNLVAPSPPLTCFSSSTTNKPNTTSKQKKSTGKMAMRIYGKFNRLVLLFLI